MTKQEKRERTHRLTGLLWVAAGVCFVALTLLERWNARSFGVLLAGMLLLPVGYSYRLHRCGIGAQHRLCG